MSQGNTVQQKQFEETPVYHQKTTVINGRFEHHMNAIANDQLANFENGGKLAIQRQIRQHNQQNATFVMTPKLFVHKINHHQMAACLGCIPIPIPLLCTIHGSVYYLYNSDGQVYPALILDVPGSPCAYCQFCWHGLNEITNLLNTNGYHLVRSTKGECTIDHSHDRIPQMLNPSFGYKETCVMCSRCVSVDEYELNQPMNRN